MTYNYMDNSSYFNHFEQVVKILDIYGIYSVSNSHCIKGWQYDKEIGRHFIFLGTTIIPDAVFVVTIALAMPITSSNFGADPMVYKISS